MLRRSTSRFITHFAAALLLAWLAPRLLAEPVPSFLIESIEVTGGSRAADRIVIAESRLREQRVYDESELRAAMARIQRLPFIVSTDFRLAKGTSPGKYTLIIRIRRMAPLFLDAESSSQWSEQRRIVPNPGGGYELVTHLARVEEDHLVVGARTFAGANGVITATGERVSFTHDRYALTFSEYDLFGSRASITAIVSYLQSPGANRSADPNARNDWHHRDNVTYEIIGVVPITGNDSLRASWQHSEFATKYNEISPKTGQYHYVLRSLPEIDKELFWIHDTTNDPLLPTSGTRWTLGGIRVSMPTSSAFSVGRVDNRQVVGTFEHSLPLFSTQALTFGGTAQDYNQVLRIYHAFALYSFDLSPHAHGGDMRLELGTRQELSRFRGTNNSQRALNASVVYRNVWGVLRITGEYIGWEKP